MRGGDFAGCFLAVMAGPAGEQPFRRVEHGRILLRDQCRRIRAYLAQDGVDEPGVTVGAAQSLRLLDGKADGGVGRYFHKRKLRRTCDQDEPRLERFGGQRLCKEAVQQILDLPQPAERSCRDGACEGAVPEFEAGESRFRAGAGEGVVERLPLAQHRPQQIDGQLARFQAGILGLRLLMGRSQFLSSRG